MEIVTVGTGAPRHFVRSGRMCSSTLLYVGGERLLFDCGPGTTVNLLKGELEPWEINYLFFTHHHYDHDADYGTFHLVRWDQGAGRAAKLNVFGPELTEHQTALLFGPDGVFERDIAARTKWHGHLWAYEDVGGKLPRTPPEVEARDIYPEQTLEFENFKITTGLAVHAQPWIDSICYRVDSDEGSVVITGDTTNDPTVRHLAQGADVLVGWTSTPIENYYSAAELAADAGVKKVVISHLGLPEWNEEIESAAQKVFDGTVIVAEDLKRVSVP